MDVLAAVASTDITSLTSTLSLWSMMIPVLRWNFYAGTILYSLAGYRIEIWEWIRLG